VFCEPAAEEQNLTRPAGCKDFKRCHTMGAFENPRLAEENVFQHSALSV
jgi:hypothetical protein